MRKNALVTTCITCVFGAFGAFFRWIQLMVAFEEDTGLYESGHISGTLMILLCLVFLAIQAFRLDKMEKNGAYLPEGTKNAYLANAKYARLVYTAISVFMILASIFCLFADYDYGQDGFGRILSVFGILAGVSYYLLLRTAEIRRNPQPDCVAVVIICVFYGLWLVFSYRTHAISPVVWSYGLEMVCLAVTLVAAYYIAGIPFMSAKPFRMMLVCQFSALLCMVTLPDERDLSQQLLMIATICMMLFISYVVDSNLIYKSDDEDDDDGDGAVMAEDLDDLVTDEIRALFEEM